MTTLQTLGLSVSLLANALLIVWCMWLSRRVDDATKTAGDAWGMAIEALTKLIFVQRLIESRRAEIDALEQEVK